MATRKKGNTGSGSKITGYTSRETQNDGVKINNKNFKSDFVNGFQELWKKSLLFDIAIVSNGVHVPAHKTVLAIHSEYFRAMFTSGLQESSQSSTTLDEIPSDVLREIVQYMYTGNLQVSKENVQDFIIGCDLLQMENLKSECCNVMDINTDVSNCLGVWQFADHFHCTSVCNKAGNIIKQQFCYVCQQEEFVSLPCDRLVTILKWKELNLGKEGENTVARCVACWLEKNLDVKVEDVKEIITSVRLCHVTDEGIDALMKTHIVEQNPELKLCITDTRKIITDPHTTRHSIYVIGGYLQSRLGPQCPRLQSTVKYSEGNWTFVSELPVLPSFVYAFTLHGKLLCFAFEMLKWTMSFGNQHESTDSGGLYEYDPYRDKWLVLTHNVSPTVLNAVKDCASRYGSFTCCKDTNTLYCVTYSKNMKVKIGMTDGEMELNESTDLLAIEDFAESMIENPASVMMDRDLYVIGGLQKYSQSDVKVLSEVYRLDPNNSSWVSLAAMNIARSACAAVALGGHLYVIGGFGRFRLSSAERYDPSVDQWTNLTRMTKERSHLNAVVVTDKIYVMGGKSYGIAGGGVRKVLRSVEEYDPDKDTWTTIEPMPQNRCLFGAVVW